MTTATSARRPTALKQSISSSMCASDSAFRTIAHVSDDGTARYHRVLYDAGAAGAAILEAGLPSALAERLQIGR